MPQHLQIKESRGDRQQQDRDRYTGDDASYRKDTLLGPMILDADAARQITDPERCYRSCKRPKVPASSGQIAAPITGASQRLKLVTGLPVAPSTQNKMN